MSEYLEIQFTLLYGFMLSFDVHESFSYLIHGLGHQFLLLNSFLLISYKITDIQYSHQLHASSVVK